MLTLIGVIVGIVLFAMVVAVLVYRNLADIVIAVIGGIDYLYRPFARRSDGVPLMTDDLTKRRAEAIQAHKDRLAKAGRDAREKANYEDQRQAKWAVVSERIIAGVMRANEDLVREAFPLSFSPHTSGVSEIGPFVRFDICSKAGNSVSRVSFWHLEFVRWDEVEDGGVLISTGEDCKNIPNAVDLDDVTEGLAVQIANELMIAVLNDKDAD
jgi:hypothetical protein